MGITIDGMVGHYERSVLMIEETDPDSVFRPALREELEILGPLRGGRTSGETPAIPEVNDGHSQEVQIAAGA